MVGVVFYTHEWKMWLGGGGVVTTKKFRLSKGELLIKYMWSIDRLEYLEPIVLFHFSCFSNFMSIASLEGYLPNESVSDMKTAGGNMKRNASSISVSKSNSLPKTQSPCSWELRIEYMYLLLVVHSCVDHLWLVFQLGLHISLTQNASLSFITRTFPSL